MKRAGQLLLVGCAATALVAGCGGNTNDAGSAQEGLSRNPDAIRASPSPETADTAKGTPSGLEGLTPTGECQATDRAVTCNIDNSTVAIGCGDGKLLVLHGHSNDVTVTGTCSLAQIEGSHNKVSFEGITDTIAIGVGEIYGDVRGEGNTVTYAAGDPEVQFLTPEGGFTEAGSNSVTRR